MSIKFSCPSCQKQYSVADAFGGKKVKCKACQAVMAVPMPQTVAAAKAPASLKPAVPAKPRPAPALDDGPDLDDLANLAPAPGDEPVHVSAAPATGKPRRKPAASDASSNAGGKAPPWLTDIVTFVDRYRPRKLWVWALVVVALLLALSFLSDTLAVGVMFTFGGVGVLILLAALAWGVILGLAEGSKAVLGVIVAAPLAIGWGLFKRFRKQAQQGAFDNAANLDTTTIVIASIGGLALMVLIAGFFSNPKAFLRPILLGLIGLGVAAMAAVPPMIRTSSGPTYAGPPSRSSYSPPQRPSPGPRPARPPRPTPPPVVSRSQTPPPGMTGVEAEGTTTKPVETSPAVSASPDLPSFITIGATINAKWGGSWWDAKVLKIERGWVQVHYSDNTYEWIQPWRIREKGSTVDDIPPAHPNSGVGKPDSPAPAGSPPPKPAKR